MQDDLGAMQLVDVPRKVGKTQVSYARTSKQVNPLPVQALLQVMHAVLPGIRQRRLLSVGRV